MIRPPCGCLRAFMTRKALPAVHRNAPFRFMSMTFLPLFRTAGPSNGKRSRTDAGVVEEQIEPSEFLARPDRTAP